MSDTTDDAVPEDMLDDLGTVPDSTPAGELSARERTQRLLAQARVSAAAAAARARQSAVSASRRNVDPTADADAPAPTLVDRAQAYRTHIISAAAAAVALLVVIVGRRAVGHRHADTVDLGDWHLEAEPIDE